MIIPKECKFCKHKNDEAFCKSCGRNPKYADFFVVDEKVEAFAKMLEDDTVDVREEK